MKWGSLNVFSFHKMQDGIVFSPESGCLATSHCWQVYIWQQYVAWEETKSSVMYLGLFSNMYFSIIKNIRVTL